MSSETGRTTEITEEELTYNFKLGISAGLGRASLEMLNRAAHAFREGDDKLATCLRSWSDVFKKVAEEARPEQLKEQKNE